MEDVLKFLHAQPMLTLVEPVVFAKLDFSLKMEHAKMFPQLFRPLIVLTTHSLMEFHAHARVDFIKVLLMPVLLVLLVLIGMVMNVLLKKYVVLVTSSTKPLNNVSLLLPLVVVTQNGMV